MRIVYVKHFLNPEGMEYFEKVWFPNVLAALKLQQGFVAITADRNPADATCIDILLKFSDEATLKRWANTSLHQSLVDGLNPYRTQSWLWTAYDSALGKLRDPTGLVWEVVDRK